MFDISFDAGASVGFTLSEQDVAKLISHPDVHRHLLMIGLKNVLQDCHASIVRKDFASDEAWIQAKRDRASLKLGALMNGELRAQSGERKARVDDFTTFARRLVLSLLPKERRKALAETEDKGAAALDAMFAKNEEKLRPQVEAMIEKARKEAEEKAKLAEGLDFDS